MKIGPLPFFAILSACLVSLPALADTTLVDEDFESYADTAAVNAVWTAVGSNGTLVDENYTQFITLDDIDPQEVGARAFPSGGQGVEHLGQGILELDVAALNGGSPLVPTPSQSIVLEADIFDVGGLGNKRMSVGLRSSTPANLIELGQWNSDPIGYAHRAILFPSTPEDPNPNWAFFELNPGLDRPDDLDDIVTIGDIGEAWATYRVTITPDTLTYEMDLFRDGLTNDGTETPAPGVDASITYDITTDANGYNSLRFGGPSGVSSAGNNFYGGSFFDNIKLTLVDVDAPLVGDYTNDGLVDAADYTLYRDTLGDSVTAGEGADGNGNGVIDPGDYTVWSDAYGSAAAASSALAIPEPTTGLLLLAGLGLSIASRKR